MKEIMLVALAAMVGSASAQTLSIAPIEAETGTQAELVVTGASLGGQTALQFNLTLPEGIILDEAAITKGAAASGHELSVSTLSSGARLFVLYNMNLDNLGNGELLRLPISIGKNASGGNAQLTTVRYASKEAESTAGKDATAAIAVKTAVKIMDAKPSSDAMHNDWYNLSGQRIGRKPNYRGIYIHYGKKMAVK